MYDCVYPTRTAVSLLLLYCHGDVAVLKEIWHCTGPVGAVTAKE